MPITEKERLIPLIGALLVLIGVGFGCGYRLRGGGNLPLPNNRTFGGSMHAAVDRVATRFGLPKKGQRGASHNSRLNRRLSNTQFPRRVQ